MERWQAVRATFPVATSSEDVFTYSVAPKWKFDEHTAIYLRVASGFRPGGPNVLPPGAPPDVPRIYESDELTSYEIGLKVESADRAWTPRLRRRSTSLGRTFSCSHASTTSASTSTAATRGATASSSRPPRSWLKAGTCR